MTQPKLIDQVRAAIRVKHYSPRTEEAYWNWIKRFILFHNKRHPNDLSELEISAFLSDLAVNKNVSASTQNQALSAILFLYVFEPVRIGHLLLRSTSNIGLAFTAFKRFH